jgi:hypothetical protein
MSWLRDKPPSRQQYTITTDRAPRRPLEHAVRPFQTIESAPPELPPVRRNRPGEDTEASICAGGPSRFLRQDLEEPINLPGTGWGFQIVAPERFDPPDGPPDANDITTVRLCETAREVEKVRVVNPENEENWVEVERIQRIWFWNEQNCICYEFVLAN